MRTIASWVIYRDTTGGYRELYGLQYPCLYMPIPIGSMYGIFTYIYHTNQPYVGKYTIHGSYMGY